MEETKEEFKDENQDRIMKQYEQDVIEIPHKIYIENNESDSEIVYEIDQVSITSFDEEELKDFALSLDDQQFKLENFKWENQEYDEQQEMKRDIEWWQKVIESGRDPKVKAI